MKILDGALNAIGDHHRSRLAADLVLREDLLVEVIHHDLGLEANGVIVPLDKSTQLALRLPGVELRVVLDGLGKSEIALNRRVVLQHVHDEAFLDGLLHGVAMERVVPDGAVELGIRVAEDLQRLVLGSGGKGKVAGVAKQPV